jgi:serine phosphatase RsbU (regulator of sigma subunit)/pSer/pThr/pTyr-binding forkhead associated (FHA) protein
MAPELRIHTQDGQVKNVPLSTDRIGLGRSSLNELCYPEDGGLSRQHLTIERDTGSWVLRDLGSKNGTLVNGSRVTAPTVLRPGDRIAAGHLNIDFVDPSAGLAETVIFVEPPEADDDTASTVVTSLAGILAEDARSADGSRGDAALQGSVQVRALVRAGRELSENRPLDELFQVIMKLSIEAVGASRGVLMTLEGNELVVRSAVGEKFTISRTVRDRVLKEKTSMLVRDASSDQLLKQQMSIVMQRVHSMIAVPLQTSDRVIGLIYVDSPHIFREFAKEHLNLLTVMANVAAIRIEHARLAEIERTEQLMQKELQQAAEIQRRLLPAIPPKVPGLELAGYNAPCRTVGGDYYDFIAYPDGRVVMLVADVAGKGMPAALLMSSLQARVQVLAELPGDLAPMVTRLNRIIASNCPANRFISLFICLLDGRTGEMTWCSAGHNPPLLLRASGDVEWLEGGGMILGILPSVQYQEFRGRLEPGDTLVLYSDGVTEATAPASEDEYGEQRLASFLAERKSSPADSLISSVLESVNEWSRGAPPADDITLVVAKRTSMS